MHEVAEENESLRDRLGMDKRKSKQKQSLSKGDVEKESDKALNVILTKEVCSLILCTVKPPYLHHLYKSIIIFCT